jgi:serralysin
MPTWEEVNADIEFYDSPNTTWQVPPNSEVLSPNNIQLTQSFLQNLFETSATAEQVLSEVANGHVLRFAGLNQQAGYAFGDPVTDVVQLNYTNLGYLYQFNSVGELVQMSASLNIIHEVIHVIEDLGDISPLVPTDSQLNAANFDHMGPTVALTNQVAVEMGWDDQIRPSYLATMTATSPRFSQLNPYESYSDDNEVDIVRLGDIGDVVVANQIDHSSRTTLLRDLVFGFGGNDTILTGAGDDYAYGGTGADTINGGDENDVLYGEADNDTLAGGEGNDFLDGGAGTNTMDGGENSNGSPDSDTVSFRSLTNGISITFDNGTFTHGSANDTVTNVENVLITDQADTVTIETSSGVIGALGGGDTINASSFDSDGTPSLVVFIAPGDGNDTVVLPDSELLTTVVLIGGDAGDQLIFNGSNLANLRSGANQTGSTSTSASWSYWVEIPHEEGNSGYEEWHLNVWLPELTPGAVMIEYADYIYGADPTAGPIDTLTTIVTIFGFQAGDYGFNGAPASNEDARQALLDFANDLGDAAAAAAFASDHVWNWIGVGTWSQSAGATSGADTFAGVASGDVADGLDGDDTLNGAGGNDTLYGSAGSDVLSGGSGVDTINGGDGADTLSGGLANDTIHGGAGADAISWTVADGSDAIDGGADVDTFNASGSAAAEVGNATWNGSSVAALMGNSLTNVEAINLDLGGGVDWLTYSTSAAVIVNLQTGSASGFASVANIEKVLGGSGNDTLTGDALDNRLDGAGGADTLNGGDGIDTVLGGDGADIIYGSAGNDSLQGQNGADVLYWISGDGRDTLNGGADSDSAYFTGSGVADVADANWNGSAITGLLDNALIDIEAIHLDLGGGGDWLRYNTTAGVTVNLASGTGTGFASITGVENLIGGTGNDSLTGDGGSNKINGNNGNDVITGGGDADNLTGGVGNDTFVYAAGCGNDTINDFDAWAVGGQDFLDVSAFGINAGNFAARVAIIDTGAETVVRIDNTYFITLKNVTGDGDNVITDADFIFGP